METQTAEEKKQKTEQLVQIRESTQGAALLAGKHNGAPADECLSRSQVSA